MRKRTRLLLLALWALAPAGASASGPAPASARRWKVVTGYDYYFPSNSGEGLRAQVGAFSDGLLAGGYDSTSYSVEAHGGTGARAGVRVPYGERVALGGTLGYVLGPTMNTDFNAYSGTFGHGGLTVSRAVTYARALGDVRVELWTAGRWGLALDSGWGGGFGRVDQTCSAVGSLTCPFNTTSRYWLGFAWELSPELSLRLKNATLLLAPRYAGFPRFKGSDEVPPIDWISVGVSLGAAF